jgi:hypothetical protein
MHKPLKGEFNEILAAVAMGSGNAKRAALKVQRQKTGTLTPKLPKK